MTYAQVLAIIQQFIVANGNNEITANVLRPILEDILTQPNKKMGDLIDLQTTDQSSLVAAINEALSLITPTIGSYNTKIHYLSLNGVDTDLPELTKIAEAVRIHGPFTCDAGQQMVFRTVSTVGTQENGSIVTRYYRLLRNMTTIGGASSSYVGIPPTWFMPDGVSEYSNPETNGSIAKLGDIGTDNVWDAFNLGDNGEAWDMNDYRFVRAIQNSEVMFWAFTGQERFYGGSDMGVEPDIFEAYESDFFLITDQPQTPSSDFRIIPYEFIIDEMLTDQAHQSTQNIIFVEKAHEDPSLDFPQGETRTYAYYQLRSDSTKTESLSDYILVSAPWANVGGGINFTTDESLYLDPSTNELRSNVGQTTQTFEWQSGTQEFELTDEPAIINYIAVNGQLLANPLTQWSVDVPNKKINILDTLEPDDIININYQFIITQ